MKLSKGLKIFSIVLECTFLGSIILYIYNYIIATKKYEIIPVEVKRVLNGFVIAGIVSLILFLILKYVLYVINKNIHDEVQLQMDLPEEVEEVKYKDLEAPVTERVFIYKDEYEIPKSRQYVCPNCGSIIDKNAFICIKCGFLLKEIQTKIIERVVEKPVEKIVEKIVEKPVERMVERRMPEQGIIISENTSRSYRLTNLIINIGLVAATVVLFILMLYIATQRGIIG